VRTNEIATAWVGRAETIWPGLALSGLVALAAQFVSDHYGAPAMLLALLLGLSLHFVVEDGGRAVAGIEAAARQVLRLGVALLGARVSFELVQDLGLTALAIIVAGVVATLVLGIAIGRLMGQTSAFSALTAGAVAICGASAAMAIAAVLPRRPGAETELGFTVFAVTLLSTVAMVTYPALAGLFGLDAVEAGLFIGASIHDVAQVVGAGYSLSDETGDTSTIVKLVRVSLLGPAVVVLALVFAGRSSDDDGAGAARWRRYLPPFLLGFAGLFTLNSLGLLPTGVQEALSATSRWMLLTAIAAVGMKTALKQVLTMPGKAALMVVVQTALIGAVVLAGVKITG
jgi:uncharacterized integral membrane protein (TIGR00698 family)